LEDQGGERMVILKWISEKWYWGNELDWSVSGQGQVLGSCECASEPSGFLECREFFD
jgi:hypothetical protein